MKSVKQLAFAALLSLGALGAVTMVSCNKEDDPIGCPVGYEGDDCTTEIRAKFEGTWTAQDEETDGTELTAYNAVITKNASSITKLNIGNFSDGFYQVNVVVNAATSTFDIPAQDPDDDGYQVEGSGSLNATTNVISVEYTITEVSSGSVKSYTGTWTKI